MDGPIEEKAHSHNYPHKTKFLLSKSHANHILLLFFPLSEIIPTAYAPISLLSFFSLFLASFSFHFEKDILNGAIFLIFAVSFSCSTFLSFLHISFLI